MTNPFKFAQNQPRVKQLDREERMMLNIQAQELDQLRMMDSFGVNADN